MTEFDNSGIQEKTKARYDLKFNEAVSLTEDLLRERTNDTPEDNQFVTIEVNGGSKYSNVGRYIEIAAFEDDLAADTELCAKEYDSYEETSSFFLSIDRIAKQPVGVLRVISNSSQGLKTLNDAQKEPFNIDINDIKRQHGITDFNKVWDIGTVAVLPKYRGIEAGLASVNLYRALYLSSIEHGIDHWVSIIDNKLLKTLKGYFAMPFVPLANSEPGSYLGSKKSYAVYAHVPEFYETVSERARTVKSLIGKNILERLINGDDDETIILE